MRDRINKAREEVLLKIQQMESQKKPRNARKPATDVRNRQRTKIEREGAMPGGKETA